MDHYLPRTLERWVLRASSQFPILLVTGARQVGKTTLLRRLAGPERAYLTLDDPVHLRLAREDPALFLQRHPGPLLIDEVQYAPELFPFLKMAADREARPGLHWLTGSHAFPLMKGVSESLAGRAAVVTLLGLSHRERLGNADDGPFLPSSDEILRRSSAAPSPGVRELYASIWRGSFPALALDETVDRDLFYGSFVQTYIQRDVRDLARVGDELAFLRFLRGAAARTACLLNLSELARDADVAVNTAKHWLSILVTSGIVHLLEPYSANLTTRLVKSPKLYFLDSGLAAYLTEWSSPASLEAGAMSGPILETWVVTELLKGYLHNGQRPPFWFFRDRDRHEIDLLIVRDGTVHPLEIKKSAAPRRDDVRAFESLSRLGLAVGPGGLVCLVPEATPLTDRWWAIPVGTV